MVVVPPGEFMMGSPKSEKGSGKDEAPRQKVSIPNKLAVGQFEITRAQFATFVNETNHDVGNKCWTHEESKWKEQTDRTFQNPGFSQDDTHPVTCVSWDDAKAYVQWLSRKTKKKYRLLSEAEWEYVARAKTNTPFWWGNSISTSQANYDGNYTYNGSKGTDRKKTVPVDSFEPNDFGLYNVHGNVFEWVEDCWHKSYDGAPNNGTAWTKGGECTKRVLRGGSWFDIPGGLRSGNRNWLNADYRYYIGGFRISRTLVSQ
jgi:formylglycine-generating enzyme required for sulfatase activity